MSENTHARHPSLVRKLLLTLMILGASGSTIGAGTFASYNASTGTSGSFDTGYLALGNQTGLTSVMNTACFSYGATPSGFSNSNSNTACDSVFTTNKTNIKGGDAAATYNFTMQNKGDVAASAMKLYRSACTAGNNGSVNGTGNPCDALTITVQETTAGFGSAVKCWFPTTATTCTASATDNVSDLATISSPLAVSSGTIAVNDLRYFTISIQLPGSATNAEVQGRSAAFSLTWSLEQ